MLLFFSLFLIKKLFEIILKQISHLNNQEKTKKCLTCLSY